jgi:hypothetical protein
MAAIARDGQALLPHPAVTANFTVHAGAERARSLSACIRKCPVRWRAFCNPFGAIPASDPGERALNPQQPERRQHDRPLAADGSFIERRQHQRRREADTLSAQRPVDDRRLSQGRRLDDWLRK